MFELITSVTEEYKKEVELATETLIAKLLPSSRVEEASSSQSGAHVRSK
jgi:hypothetical protein